MYSFKIYVGKKGLEPLTLRLSSVYSNQLSYLPKNKKSLGFLQGTSGTWSGAPKVAASNLKQSLQGTSSTYSGADKALRN